MGLLDRIGPRRGESEPTAPAAGDPVFATKALRKFLAALTSHENPVLLDLGSVVGSNVSFFGEQLGCKIFVEDICADVERHLRDGRIEELPEFLKKRFPQEPGSVDGILCWDVFDYVDRPAAQVLVEELTRLLRPDGAVLGLFGTAPPRASSYTKYVVVDEATLKYRTYPARRGRLAVLLNGDIIRLFAGHRVSESFLLQNNLREMLFRKSP